MSLENIVFVQQLRTETSEIWLADFSRSNQEAFAQIDIHYPPKCVEATVVLFKPLKTPELLHRFLDLIDEELISVGELARGNLRFRVIHGGINKPELFQRPTEKENGEVLEDHGNG